MLGFSKIVRRRYNATGYDHDPLVAHSLFSNILVCDYENSVILQAKKGERIKDSQ